MEAELTCFRYKIESQSSAVGGCRGARRALVASLQPHLPLWVEMMMRILIATDGNIASEAAIEMLLRMPLPRVTEIILLTVVQTKRREHRWSELNAGPLLALPDRDDLSKNREEYAVRKRCCAMSLIACAPWLTTYAPSSRWVNPLRKSFASPRGCQWT